MRPNCATYSGAIASSARSARGELNRCDAWAAGLGQMGSRRWDSNHHWKSSQVLEISPPTNEPSHRATGALWIAMDPPSKPIPVPPNRNEGTTGALFRETRRSRLTVGTSGEIPTRHVAGGLRCSLAGEQHLLRLSATLLQVFLFPKQCGHT